MITIANLKAILPEPVLHHLTVHGCYLDESSAVHILSRGLSNQNFAIQTPKGQWALRINSAASNSLCERHQEVANWHLAEQAQLAPRLVYVSDDYRFYLSQFIQVDQDWSELMTANSAHPIIDYAELWPGAEHALLSLLKALSQLPLPDNHMSVRQQWREYTSELSEQCKPIAADTKDELNASWFGRWHRLCEHHQRVSKLLDTLDACMVSPQYSHRDLNPHNLLFKSDKVWCIDYEYACSSHPLVDLASVLATHRLSTPQRHRLISTYLKDNANLNEHALAAVPSAIELYWYFGACWALLMVGQVAMTGRADISSLADNQTCLPHSVDDYFRCFDDFMALIA